MNRAEKRRQQKAMKKNGQWVSKRLNAQQLQDVQAALDKALNHQMVGQFGEAEAIYRKILEIEPDHPTALHLLSMMALSVGQNDIALELINTALRAHPRYPKGLITKADILAARKHKDAALQCLKHALKIAPKNVDVHFALASLYQAQGQYPEAVRTFKDTLKLSPNVIGAFNNLGLVYKEMGQLDDAIEMFSKALDIDANFADARLNMGTTYKQKGDRSQAVACYGAITDKADVGAKAATFLAIMKQEDGQLDEAIGHFQKAIHIKPHYGEAHMALAHSKKFTSPDDPDIQAMQKSYSAENIAPDVKSYIGFGLGKAFDDLKAYEKAFEFYTQANALTRQTFDLSLEDDWKLNAALKDGFRPDVLKTFKGAGCPDASPVFILGMPRSGTTLVEQILASHPSVYGCGELTYIHDAITPFFGDPTAPKTWENLSTLEPHMFSEFGEDYIRKVRALNTDSVFVTDKMPGNFMHVGLIKLALPNAKIIHCNRDPRSVCLSIFRTRFVDSGLYYAYDQRELGEYHRIYQDIMAHWQTVLPGEMYELHYEDLIEDQETQTRKLLDFIGLAWDEACLNFHKTERPVKTASLAQARNPIYSDSLQPWQRYKPWINPLLEELGLAEE